MKINLNKTKMKITAKALSIAIFLAFGLFTAITSFPQALNAAPPGNPPSANVSPTFSGLTVTGTSTLGTLNAGATTLSSGSVTGDLSTGGNLSVTGTSTLGNLDLRGNLANTAQLCYGLICFDNPISINDILTVTGNSTFSSNLTVNGNTTIKGNTTLGDAITDTVTINGTQKTTQDIKSDRFIRAKVDSNGMGGIGRFYSKSRNIPMANGSNLNDIISCDSPDWAVACMGGFTDCAGSTCGISAIYADAGGSTCRAKAYNNSGAARNFKIEARCYAPDENWYFDNGSWRIMSYDGTLGAPIGL